jgi:uncharacterized protein
MANGQIGWVELHADDGNKLGDFYEQVFDWKIQRDPNMPEYVMFSDGQLAGGFSTQMGKAAGHMYLLTEDIDQSLKSVEAAGGKTVTAKTPISEEIGAWAQFEDPAGNVMGLFEQVQR